MNQGHNVHWSEIGLTLLSVTMIGAGQILFKLASASASYEGISWRTVAAWLSPAMLAALFISTLATGLWVWVLRTASLSVVYPLYALTFVLVPLLEWSILGAALNWRHGLGALAIVLGIWMMTGASA